MFVRVNPDDFVVGIKYKMAGYKGIFVNRGREIYGIWHYMFYSNGTNRYFISNLDFYIFVSDNPQWKMERRSVNLIVRRLIGDDNFEW